MSTYALSRPVFMVQDSPERIDFHIRAGDYFSYLATLAGVLEETVAKCGSSEITDTERKMVRDLRHDLRYIHANYKIVPRTLDDIRLTHPGRNLLSK